MEKVAIWNKQDRKGQKQWYRKGEKKKQQRVTSSKKWNGYNFVCMVLNFKCFGLLWLNWLSVSPYCTTNFPIQWAHGMIC